MPGLILHVGDSHVQGLNVPAAAIVAQAERRYIPHPLQGKSTRQLAEMRVLPELVDAYDPDALWLTFGTNDGAFDRDAFAEVNRQAGTTRPIVWWAPPALQRADLRALPASWFAGASLAAPGGVWIVRSTDYTRADEVRRDGVHLTGPGYKSWARGAAWESIFFERIRLREGPSAPPTYLVALAEEESGLDPRRHNSASGATGIFQVTQIALDQWNQDLRDRLRLRDMYDPLACTDVALHIISICEAVLRDAGIAAHDAEFGDRRYVELVTQCYNAGPYAVAGILRQIGPDVTAADVATAARRLPPSRTLPANAPLRDAGRLRYVVAVADRFEAQRAGRPTGPQTVPGPSEPAPPPASRPPMPGPPGDERPRRASPLLAGLGIVAAIGIATALRCVLMVVVAGVVPW